MKEYNLSISLTAVCNYIKVMEPKRYVVILFVREVSRKTGYSRLCVRRALSFLKDEGFLTFDLPSRTITLLEGILEATFQYSKRVLTRPLPRPLELDEPAKSPNKKQRFQDCTLDSSFYDLAEANSDLIRYDGKKYQIFFYEKWCDIPNHSTVSDIEKSLQKIRKGERYTRIESPFDEEAVREVLQILNE